MLTVGLTGGVHFRLLPKRTVISLFGAIIFRVAICQVGVGIWVVPGTLVLFETRNTEVQPHTTLNIKSVNIHNNIWYIGIRLTNE